MSAESASTVPVRALVIANEHSSHAVRMRRQVGELDLPTETIHTHEDERRTRDEVYALAREGDVLLGAGGDGTANQIANMLLSPEGQARGLHNLPFVPLRGGNANDTPTMINGRKTAAEILRTGHDVFLRPLEVRIDDNVDATRYALGYFSVGATAAASQRLEEIKSTANKFTHATRLQLLREMITVWRAVGSYGAFKMQLAGETPEVTTDYLLLRGNRIAKLGRPHADLTKPQFEAVPKESSGMTRALFDMIKMQQGRLLGTMQESVSFMVETADNADMPVQYDGEVAMVASGSRLSVGIAPVAYRTLSTRL